MRGVWLFFLVSLNLFAMQLSFDDGKNTAESMRNGIEDEIKSGKNKGEIPQYQEGVFISKDELANSFGHLQNSEHGKDLVEIHKTRKPYILDDTEPFMVRSEDVHRHPEEAFEQTEEIQEEGDATIETCEECPHEEFFVKAYREKINLVFITAARYCPTPGHQLLAIDVRMHYVPSDLLAKGGPFNSVKFVSSRNEGAYSYETYNVDGYDVVLRKTIKQNGRDGIHPRCYLVPALNRYVLTPKDLINNLLGLNTNEAIYWGEIGNAQLNTIEDQYYYTFDDRGAHYEQLVEQGLCRYVSAAEVSRNSRMITQEVTYACRSSCKDTCQKLRARGCSRLPNPECLERIGDKCVHWRWKFKCKDRIGMKKHKFSKLNPFCLEGNCIDSSYESDKDMIEALGYLSILEEARKELDGTDNINVFKGNPYSCTRFLLSFKDCCGCNGWGISMGLSSCDEDSRNLARLRENGKCVYVGEYCAEKLPVVGTCVRKKKVFCCFGSKFAKLLQEQGKPQLGLSFGTPKCPDCRGFTADELSHIDFSKLDLTEITNDIMDKFKPQKGEHFAKGGELDRIRQQMQDKMQNTGNTEASYLKENMRHLVGSLKSGGK